jgi:hypothetical protein
VWLCEELPEVLSRGLSNDLWRALSAPEVPACRWQFGVSDQVPSANDHSSQNDGRRLSARASAFIRGSSRASSGIPGFWLRESVSCAKSADVVRLRICPGIRRPGNW